MQLKTQNTDCCTGDQLIVIQEQGENNQITILFPFDVSQMNFKCTINLPIPVTLTIGSGLEHAETSDYAIFMQLASDQTENVPAGQYSFDLWSMDSEMQIINDSEMTGFFTIHTALTRIP